MSCWGLVKKFREPTVTGFPFRLNLRLQKLVFVGPGDHLKEKFPDITVVARAWALTDIKLAAPRVYGRIKVFLRYLICVRQRVSCRSCVGRTKVAGKFRLTGLDWVQRRRDRVRIDEVTLKSKMVQLIMMGPVTI